MRRMMIVAALAACVATPAMAEFVGLQSVSPGQGMNVVSTGNVAHNTTGGVMNLRWDLDGVIAGASFDAADGAYKTVTSFCIDIVDTINFNTYYSFSQAALDTTPDGTAGPMGVAKAQYLATLLNKYWTNWSTNASRTVNGVLLSANEMGAAVQLAVWEILDENRHFDPVPAGWDVTAGDFRLTSTTLGRTANAANFMLDTVAALGGSGFGNYEGLTCTTQDFVVRVPIPGAVLLGLLGLSAAGLGLRRFA